MNFKLKNNRYFLVILFTVFCISSCSNEYIEYHKVEDKKIEQELHAKKESENFSVDKIEYRDLQIMSAPDKTIIDKIISKIDSAKENIYLETYILTEKRILKSIIEAKKRGIEIKVILEKNVIGASNMNKKAFDSLLSAGAQVKYANSKNYNFTHSKFFLIDNEYIISTGNVSYSTYTTNKEFFVFGDNKEDYNNLKEIFNKDFNYERYVYCGQVLTVSPICPRNQLIKIISSAKNNILIFEQSIDDLELQNLLIEKAKAGIKISILIGDVNIIKGNKEVIEKFLKAGIKIKSPKKPYIHAKAFMIDDKIINIGSINFTYNSIENNREVGIVFYNKEISKYFKNEFERLFANVQ